MLDLPDDIVVVGDAVVLVGPVLSRHRGIAVKIGNERLVPYRGRYRAYQVIGNQTFFVLVVGARTLLLNVNFINSAYRADQHGPFTQGAEVVVEMRLTSVVQARYTGRFDSYWMVGGKTFLAFRQRQTVSWVALDAVPILVALQ